MFLWISYGFPMKNSMFCGGTLCGLDSGMTFSGPDLNMSKQSNIHDGMLGKLGEHYGLWMFMVDMGVPFRHGATPE